MTRPRESSLAIIPLAALAALAVAACGGSTDTTAGEVGSEAVVAGAASDVPTTDGARFEADDGAATTGSESGGAGGTSGSSATTSQDTASTSDDGGDTTDDHDRGDTTGPTITSSTEESSTTEDTSTSEIKATVPAALTAGTFSFSPGPPPGMGFEVELSTQGSSAGWLPAGPNDPAIEVTTGSQYWVRLSVTNFDLGAITTMEVDIEGLGQNLCPISGSVRTGETFRCSLGPFVAESGDKELPIRLNRVSGLRQGSSTDRRLDPPLTAPPPFRTGHRFAIAFYLDSGATIHGTTDDPQQALGAALPSPVPVDCSDHFPGGYSSTGYAPAAGDPAVVAFAIVVYDENGSVDERCSLIPTHSVNFTVVEGTDNRSVNYLGT